MHQIHTGRAPQYLVDFVQPVAECSRRSANTAKLRQMLHTRTEFGECCFSHATDASPAAWNFLPASIKLTTDTNRLKKLIKSHLFRIALWHFVSAPGQFVSRALQIPICIICTCNFVLTFWSFAVRGRSYGVVRLLVIPIARSTVWHF